MTDTSRKPSSKSHESDWNRRYEVGDTPWDYPSPSKELIRRLTELALPPCRVVEFGCGTGTNSIFLANQGFSVVGIDSSTAAISIARQKALKEGVDVDFHVQDACQLDCTIGQFDLVFERGFYHFIRLFNLDGFLRSLYEVTHPGSLFLSLAGNDNEGRKWGPPRVSATKIINELSPFFDLKDLREFRFDDAVFPQGPLGWSTVWSRRSKPRLITRVTDPLPSRSFNTSQHLSEHEDLKDKHKHYQNKDDLVIATKSLEVRLQRILDSFHWGPSCPWIINLIAAATSSVSADLKIAFQAKDRDTGVLRQVNYERKNAFNSFLSNQDVLEIVIANLSVIAVHEMLESTLVCDQYLFDPHNVRRLLDLRYAEALTGVKTGV